ncbi:MAG TPA: carboxypeptidase regulatory-like domain-containing protein [Bryobacteraceae bacterium]|nr:carboxypeptidase regulatory-like domain-containing protein [Bryobacteraceae bacterium]HWR35185.1 carboxypeptidase regulatory-like domain-containing protein [Clostridia bacterium]
MKRNFALLGGLLLASLLWSQEFRATLSGRIMDSTGASIAGSTVLVKNVATNEQNTTVSDAQGDYRVPFLRPGTYQVSAEAPGFKKFVRSGLILNLGQAASLEIKLEVGGVTEQVTVTSEAPLLDAVKADRGSVIDNQRVTQFALNGGNPMMLSRLVPGVGFTGQIAAQGIFSQGAIEKWAMNGGLSNSNSFQLDGAPNDTKAFNGGVGYVPPVDSVQEFKIQTNIYDAQYGRTSGGILNISVKSGTNVFHGTGYEYLNRSWGSANSFQNNAIGAPRGQSTRDQFGFHLEGPVLIPKVYDGRNRTFVTGTFESMRNSTPMPLLLSVPEADMRAGDFSKLVDANNRLITIYDPTTGRDINGVWTRTPFAGNVIPKDRINPIATNILGFMPKANTKTAGQGYSRLNYQVGGAANPGSSTGYSVVGKLDHNLGDNHRFFFRRGWSDWTYHNSFNGLRGLGEYSNEWGEKKINDSYVLDWVGTLSPTFIANLRLSFNFFNNDRNIVENANYPLTKHGFPESMNNQVVLPDWFGRYEFSNYTTLGGYYQINHTNNFGIQPTVTKVIGPHVIKTGLDLRWTQWSVGTYNSNPPFTLAANPGWTQQQYNRADALSGDSVASFLLGTPSSGSASVNAFPIFLYRYYAPWIQDDWKVSRRLTLNLGFRWDLNHPPTERFNRLTRGFDAQTLSPVDALINRAAYPGTPPVRGGMLFTGVGGNSRMPAKLRKSNFQPRFGFAYSLRDNLVVRGGWGRTYMNPTESYDSLNYGFSQRTDVVTSLDGTRTSIPNVLNNPFPNGVIAPAGASRGLLTFLGQGFNVANPEFRIPYLDQFSLGFQYGLPFSSKVEISYVGSRGHDLQDTYPFNNYDVSLRNKCNLMEGGNPLYCDERLPNPFYQLEPFTGTSLYSSPTVARTSLAVAYPQFGTLTEVNRNDGKSWYNSLQITWETRRKSGLNVMVSYTLSKQIMQRGWLDSLRMEPQRGLVDWDRPHRLSIGSIYELPFGKGKHWLNTSHPFWSRLVSGWENATMFFYESGRPWALPNVITLKDARVGDVDWSAPDVRAVQPCVAQWNDNGSITMQPYSVSYGCKEYYYLVPPRYSPRFSTVNDGRIRLHSAPQVDLSLNKTTQITEKTRLQFRAEAFNATNTYLFLAQPFNNSVTSALFGTLNKASVSTANSNRGRTIQLGLKFLW